jgi:hypothetical protein
MGIKGIAKTILKKTLARFGVKLVKMTPMEKVLSEISRRRIKIENLNALEIFGYIGTWHTLDYDKRVKTLDVWEIDPKCEEFLRSNLPMAEIKITDSFEEIKKTDKKYGFIVSDNSFGVFVENNKFCEHFELFPHIFRIMQDECILILNVTTKVEIQDKDRYPYLFNEEHLKRRGFFYFSGHPDSLTFEEMASVYAKYAKENGFNLEWYFTQKRTFVYYLVIKLRKVLK